MIPPMSRDWYRVSPTRFEEIVVQYLDAQSRGLESFSIEHQGKVAGPDGEFVLDGVARFRAMGVNFTVLVECKHHRRRVERGLVQALADKVASVRAHKGIMFATGGYQDGAIEYARSRSIALVHVTKGGPVFESRGADGPEGPSRECELWLVSWKDKGGWEYSGPSAGIGNTWWGDAEQSGVVAAR